MGKISNRIIKLFEKEFSKIVVDIEDIKKSKAKALKNIDEIKSIESLVKETGSLDQAIYYNLQNLVSVIIDDLIMLKPMNSFYKFLLKVTDLYQPGYPPHSPITGSYFNLWTTFDVSFGDDNETLGTCIYDLSDRIHIGEIQKQALNNLCKSRMGVYEVLNSKGLKFDLKELVSNKEYSVKVNSGYVGQSGDLILLRIVPPIYESIFLSMTTPYQLEGYTKTDWLEYFSRQNINNNELGFENRLHNHFKFEKEKMYWSEFIFYGYLQHRSDVVYLAGLPDKVMTQPHHDKFNDTIRYRAALSKVQPLLKVPPFPTSPAEI